MHLHGDALRFSASDLAAFLDGDFAMWMERWHLHRNGNGNGHATGGNGSTDTLGELLRQCKADDSTPELKMLRKRGLQHEARHLERLKRQFGGVVEIANDLDGPDRTLRAMQDGAAVIFQGHLNREPFVGIADFLIRCDGASRLGDYHYEPWDTKLAKRTKPHYLIQLCTYADMLEHVQGVLPRRFVVVLGTGEEHAITVDSCRYYYEELKRRFLEFHRTFDPNDFPHPGMCRGYGRWGAAAQEIIERTDHLSRVAGMRRPQIMALEEAGICTVADLARTAKTRGRQVLSKHFDRLQQQADLQRRSRDLPRPEYRLIPADPEDPRRGLALLPPASKGDVFFDLEGFPLVDGGLEYLIGAVHLVRGKPQFKDWWAHDARQEKAAFESFIDWVYDRWQRDPSMHIYHYASYERTAMQRLTGKYATRETQLDELLRAEVFVDLFTVVRQALVVGTPSYSLKDVEKLYAPQREGEVKTAAGSMVAYEQWLEAQDGASWQESKILKEIRDYNEIDCDSTWRLAEWLRALQAESGIGYLPPPTSPEESQEEVVKPPRESEILAERLQTELDLNPHWPAERRRMQELLANLLGFHWREAKPVFWRMYDRAAMTEQELMEDLDCLGGLQRTRRSPERVKRSTVYEYKFDPEQETKLHEGSGCYFAHDITIGATIHSIDLDAGLVEIRLGPRKDAPPSRLNLIPNEYVSAKTIADAVYRYVAAWSVGKTVSRAVDDLLARRKPRIKGHDGGPLIQAGENMVDAVVRVVEQMDSTLLCIQGPPGTGKTYCAAKVIAELVMKGRKVGVTSNSHKAIVNVLSAVARRSDDERLGLSIVKVGGDPADLPPGNAISHLDDSAAAETLLDGGALVIGGTAWLFSREAFAGRLDYLFVDEAGQFSLANTVAVGVAAKNLILIGDQRQLAQPTIGTHPGESGQSALEYMLGNLPTIPADLGVFLGTTWRMHPKVCEFISSAIYERRLSPHADTACQRLQAAGPTGSAITKENGVLFVPVEHQGNSQSSDEEAAVIKRIAKELIKHQVYDRGGTVPRQLTWDDVLFVAPFNMQVRKLEQTLGTRARVGSVDKFQGQEAHVVIVSMCSSSAEDSPRGLEFLLNPNRLNVAVSRAKTLAIVVGSPGIMAARCQSLSQIELVNLYCWLGSYAGVASAVS